MAKLRIEGGRRLSGRITVEGNKNSALPLLAACLLTDQECVLTNVPRIRDVAVLVDLMVGNRREVDGVGTSTLRVRCEAITGDRPDPVLVGSCAGPCLLLGPLLARKGSAQARPARRGLPGAAHHHHAPAGARGDGAVELDEPGHALEAPSGLTARRFISTKRR
jgi:UDP-N-acetylglucosamine 1-carboxyvinyltransferase